MRCKVGGGFGEENTDKWTGEVKKKKRQGRNPLQCAKHAQLFLFVVCFVCSCNVIWGCSLAAGLCASV